MATKRTRSVKTDVAGAEEFPDTFKAIRSRFGESSIHAASDHEQPERIGTGVFMLDFALLGGIPHNRISMIVGERSAGKAGRATDHVLTPTGWVKYQDIREGSFVIGADGTPTEVLQVHHRGVLPMRRVTFSDKSSVVVATDHLWQVSTRKQASTTGNFYVMSTEDISRLNLRPGVREPAPLKYRIPMVHPVEYALTPVLPLPPYLLGVLLANGYLKGATFATNDMGVIRTIESLCYGYSVTEQGSGKSTSRHWNVDYYTRSGTRNTVITALRSLGLYGCLSVDKFIPDSYLYSSPAERLVLLQGLMDCDGSCDGGGSGGNRYHTRSRRLSYQIQELAQSLGGTAPVTQTLDASDGKTDYTVSIALPIGYIPFLGCRKKLVAFARRKHNSPTRSIASITEEDEAEAVCITVATGDGLYVTEQYIVTHNSMLADMITASAQRQYPDMHTVKIDTEGAHDTVWSTKLGVDPTRQYVFAAETGESAVDAADALVRTKEVSLVVIDSIAALTPMKEIDSSAEDAMVGAQARLVGGMIRRVNAGLITERNRGHYVTVLFINQFRSKIGVVYGDSRSLPGGKALEFATSVQLIVKNKEQMGKDAYDVEAVAENEHVFDIKKNKVNAGPRTGEFRVRRIADEALGLVEGQVDDASTMLAYAKKFGAYTGAGSSWTLSFWDEEHNFRGLSAAVIALYANRPLYDKLRNFLICEQATHLGMPQNFLERFYP